MSSGSHTIGSYIYSTNKYKQVAVVTPISPFGDYQEHNFLLVLILVPSSEKLVIVQSSRPPQ